MSSRGEADGGRAEERDGDEVEDDDSEMRPEARDALLWETAVIES
jgi:hypothetical protein